MSEPRWWATSRAEFAARSNDEALEHVRNNGSIPDIPAVILAAEASAGIPEVDAAHHQCLEELAQQSAQGRFVLAEDSSHDVVRGRPEWVVQTILEVVDSARDR